MDVNIPQPFAHELAAFYELQHFIVICNGCHRKVSEQGEYFRPVLEVAASKFANDKRMTGDVALISAGGRATDGLLSDRCD